MLEASSSIIGEETSKADEHLPEDGKEAAGGDYDPFRAYIREILNIPVLTREQELELGQKCFRQNDQQAVQTLARHNLRLVVKIALEYYNPHLDILDLIQEGNFGLMKAAKKYNPGKGTKFSTYASFWIRAYILKFIMDSWSLVRIGTTQAERRLFFRLNKEKNSLKAKSLVSDAVALAKELEVRPADIVNMQIRLACPDVSLDQPLVDGSNETLMDIMEAGETDILDMVLNKETTDNISQAMAEFKKTLANEKDVYLLEWRLLDEEPLTLEKIARKFHLSRERIRQREKKVIGRLREFFSQQPELTDRLAGLEVEEKKENAIKKRKYFLEPAPSLEELEKIGSEKIRQALIRHYGLEGSPKMRPKETALEMGAKIDAVYRLIKRGNNKIKSRREAEAQQSLNELKA